MKLANMKLAHLFAALLAILVAGFALYGAWSFKVLGELKVNGPLYQRIVQGKDLIADILPPPEYIIESYLVSLQAAGAAPAERKALIDNLKALKADYDTRHAFWIQEGLEAQMKDLLLVQADKPAQQFYQLAFEQFIPALERDDAAAAGAALGAMKARYDAHRAAINQLVELATKRNAADEERAKGDIAAASAVMLAILIGVIAVVSLFLLVVRRNLMRQLGCEPFQAAAIAGRIAAGDLAVRIDTAAGDQGSLLVAIKRMRDSLADIAGRVRDGTEAISSAAGQIASGNMDLSARTENQASSLEQTASAVEELTSTVKQNGDNARQANQMAASASSVALKGGSIVAQVVDTMGSINESSRKIVDIIGVIDGIAFQTNILALNAAVEAARAGEQGRGFAVVATEVRSLAQRSAGAAKEIKELIGDSVDKVEAGSKLVNEAGATMDEIVASVKRVTDIMGEITCASREQEVGIEQIHHSITSMDDVTQQNAALVEEASGAATSLHEQAGHLLQVVSVFKLDPIAAVRMAPPAAAPRARPALKALESAPQASPPARQSSAKKAVNAATNPNEEWEEF
jgi:methyl-accepting chemotaxis protein